MTGSTITFGGHATVLIELNGLRILTDPVLRNRVLHLRRHGPPAPVVNGPVDLILISHAHPDHLDLPSLRRFGPDTRFLVPAGAAHLLEKAGFSRIGELAPGEAVEAGNGVEVRAVPAIHDGRRYPWLPDTGAMGFRIEGSRTIYFAGDTDLFPGMGRLGEGGLDLALLPIWGWGHRLGAGHMDPRRAALAARLLRPRLTVPIHWGTYFPVGMKRIRGQLLEKPAVAFREQMETLAPELECRILRSGQSAAIPGPGSDAAPGSQPLSM